MALLTDKDWIRHGASAFGWLSPGELRLFEPGEQEAAKAWVAAIRRARGRCGRAPALPPRSVSASHAMDPTGVT